MSKTPEGSISRRNLLRQIACAAGASAVVALTAQEAAAAKAAQTDVAYQGKPNGIQSCQNCAFFRRPNRCDQVEGFVIPLGWCNIWKEAS